jgi:predicted phosphodiesterase
MKRSEGSLRVLAPGVERTIAFISDPHGDLVALHKVIGDLERSGPFDEVLVGGDLAQGGPQPAEVVDDVRSRGWHSVRGNSDDFLVRIADRVREEGLPEAIASRGAWSVDRLGTERIEYLRALPISIQRGPLACGSVVLVHATPWSTEDVVLPDADLEIAERMGRAVQARLLVYGHIHTPYQRRVGDGAILSVGAVSGSNDTDPRPAYTIVTFGTTITAEVRRVDWPVEERLAAYAAAGVELSAERIAAIAAPGPFPVRSQPGVVVTLWP